MTARPAATRASDILFLAKRCLTKPGEQDKSDGQSQPGADDSGCDETISYQCGDSRVHVLQGDLGRRRRGLRNS